MKQKSDKVTLELPFDDAYTVYFNGEPITRLNDALVQQGITDEGLEELKRLHQDRLLTEQFMEGTDDPKKLKALFEVWTNIQYSLQMAWGFPEDANYHRFWEVPKCACPPIDNSERLGTPYKIVDSACPIHGELV